MQGYDLHKQINQTWNLGNGNDESGCSTIQLFEPASTTFVKHFIAKTQYYGHDDQSSNDFIAGYL